MKETIKEIFKVEAYELLSELEKSLLGLEETPQDAEMIGAVFRALHTIKGSGAMAGFDSIAAFTHEVEAVFELVRNGRLLVTKRLIDLTLIAGDHIRTMLESSEGVVDVDSLQAIITELRELMPRKDSSAKSEQPEPDSSDASGQESAVYRICLRPHKDLFLKGVNPILLLNELRGLGDCEIIAHTDALEELDSIDPESCLTYWDAILTTERGIDAIRDIFIFVEDDCDITIDVIAKESLLDGDQPAKRIGEILVERGCLSKEDLLSALNEQKRIGQLLVASGLVGETKVHSALVEQQHVQEMRKRQQKTEEVSNIRVPAQKLDALVDLVGELVTVQARLSQTSGLLNHPELLSIAEEVERLTAELRDNTMSIRMVAIGTMFSRFKRLVRDLSSELGKDILFATEGAETELDKKMIERLSDPLVHLIRNSIDHGIELSDSREASGKPRQGTIRLAATHSGANVLISITDDGAGLDVEAIKARAVERKLMAPDCELPEKEIFSFIFAPGFSTAAQVTSVSGRGVGMDVVKRSIDALRGSIDISSRRGVGTTITIKLPLTLAIIDGLLVKVGEGYFVLPLSAVEECVELSREDVSRAHGRHITRVRDKIVPYIRLRERFDASGEAPEIEQIVITEGTYGKVGFVVDSVIGEHQTVIKNLGRMYRDVEGISGATILGDGTVALILDMPQLVKGIEDEETAADLQSSNCRIKDAYGEMRNEMVL